MEKVRYTCEGLPTGGILVSDIREEVTETTVCSYFGPKSLKSGWRFQSHTIENEQEAILSLYRRVYGADEPPNKEITLSFAKGLILMSEGHNVIWAQFAAERKKVREALRKKSECRKEREREREVKGPESRLSAPLFGKKRESVQERDDIGLSGSLRLIVKSQVVAEGLGMGKKSGRLGTRSVGGLRWEREEIESTVRAIEYHEGLSEECKKNAAESRRELLAIEDKVRREKLLLSDRQLMLDEVKLRLKSIGEEELSVEAALEAKSIAVDTYSTSVLQGNLGCGTLTDAAGLQAEIAAITSQRGSLKFKKASDELTARLCVTAILGCTEELRELERALLTSSETNKMSESRVSALDSVLVSMREQLRKMEVGDGAAVYPRPSENSPKQPVVEHHKLNACPVCSLWYESFDYSALACGHTYHPFCLYDLAQRSEKCLVLDCEKPFTRTNLGAFGIRPSMQGDLTPRAMRRTSKDAAVKSSTQTESGLATIGAPTSPTLSWAKDSPSKIFLLSQSSQTDVTSKQCILEPTEKTNSTVMCDICKRKEASVFIKACGHDVFCFTCVQGLELCPICGGTVTGWGRLNLQPKPNPFLKAGRLDSSHGKSELVVEKTVKEKENSASPEQELTKVGSDFNSSDDSDSDNDIVHWCGSEEFSNGGAQSGQDCVEGEFTDTEEDEELPTSPAPVGKKHTKSRFVAVSTLLASDVDEHEELESCPSTRKRGRSKFPTENHVQKFKKIVEMAAEDILGPVTGAWSPENGLCDAADVPRKKRVGRPPKASKVQGKKKQDVSPVTKHTLAVKEDVAPINRCRTTPRRHERPLDAILVKFRGM